MKIRALLVDDDTTILQLFRTVLEINDFEVETAASAQDGCRILEEKSFDMVITDLRMETPKAGFEVVRFATALVPRPIVVIVTAFPVPSAEWRLTGADALYVKGANTMALPEQLRELLRRNTQRASEMNSPARRANSR